jgi:CheY-like chemotaxis protein
LRASPVFQFASDFICFRRFRLFLRDCFSLPLSRLNFSVDGFMPAANACDTGATVLVAEDDVIVRIAVAEYLRDCGFRVIEAAGGLEAKTVLTEGPDIHILFADAGLAGDDNGFALAQWARRYRPKVNVILTTGLANKSEAASHLCSRNQTPPPPPSHLRDRIRDMKARHIRNILSDRKKPKARAAGE